MNQARVKIREYKQTDRKSILAMMQEFTEYHWPINPFKKKNIDSKKVATYHTNKMIKYAKTNDGIIYVAQGDGNIIGFIGVWLKKQTYEDALEEIPMTLGYINAVFVTENYRGSGIGRKLLNKAEQYFILKKCTHVTLHVYDYNVPSHEFYKKLGYIDWYIEMVKTL